MTSIALTRDEAKLARREKIFEFENAIKKFDGHYEGDSERNPLKHSFTDGIYVREIRIPAGERITGKIHKHEHPNFLMSGTVIVYTEGAGEEILEGPLAMISPPGTKRALVALTDLWWITIHHNVNNSQNLVELEDGIIAEDYNEYEKFLENKKLLKSKEKVSFIDRIKKMLHLNTITQ